MDTPSITTIAHISEGLYKERGSKFHAYAFPVKTLEEIKTRLTELKQDHPKARHHCYAYRLGPSETMEYANDAGEPSGSAGLPILNALRSMRVKNVLVVVVRYFGGTKLGIPGLIHAYKTASLNALEHNQIVIRELMKEFVIRLDYEKIDSLYRLIGKCNGKILDQIIDTTSRFRISIPVKNEQTLLASCSDEMEIAVYGSDDPLN